MIIVQVNWEKFTEHKEDGYQVIYVFNIMIPYLWFILKMLLLNV